MTPSGGSNPYTAIRQIPGIGPVLAAVFVAEIGDVSRFPGPAQLASWAGLTPQHRESGTTVHRGRITKQGCRLVRWAAVESVQMLPKNSRVGTIRERVGALCELGLCSDDTGRARGGPGRVVDAQTADRVSAAVISAVIGEALKPLTIR